LVGIWPPRP